MTDIEHALTRAAEWHSQHQDHVKKLVTGRDENTANYAPSGSDLYRPELWRAPHWRWYLTQNNNATI